MTVIRRMLEQVGMPDRICRERRDVYQNKGTLPKRGGERNRANLMTTSPNETQRVSDTTNDVIREQIDCDRTVIRQARNPEEHRGLRSHTE